MLAVTTASTHPVTHVAFHPDGTSFAVAQPNHGVTLLDRSTGRPTASVPVPRAADYRSLVFLGNGERIAASCVSGVYVLDVAAGTVVARRGGALFAGAALTAGGGELVAANRSGVRTVHISAGTPDRSLTPLSRPLQSKAGVVALSPCGRWAFGVYGRVRPSLLDLDTGRVRYAVDHPCREVLGEPPAVVFSTDGSHFAVYDGNDISVYQLPADEPADAEDDEPDPSLLQRAGDKPAAPKPRELLAPVFRLEPAPGEAPPKRPAPRLAFRDEGVPPNRGWRPPVAFTPGGRGLLVRRPRNRVQLWDVATGSHAGEWSWRFDGVLCLAVAPDGLAAVAGARRGSVVVWDLE